MVGGQLINGSDVNQTNGDVNASLLMGLISSSHAPGTSSNSTMLVWGGSSFTPYTFYNSADATVWEDDDPNVYPAGWYKPDGSPASVHLTNGASVFIRNNSAIAPMTVTTIGTVFQGQNVSVIKAGLNLIGLQVPISTNVCVGADGSALPYGLPLNMTSTPNPPGAGLNDQMLFWNGNSYTPFTYYNSADATVWEDDSPNVYPAGFYKPDGSPATYPAVNQGFFIKHIGASINWTNSFTVQ